jgi:hypothetical protein
MRNVLEMYCKYILLLSFIFLILYVFTALGLHDANEQHHVVPPFQPEGCGQTFGFSIGLRVDRA